MSAVAEPNTEIATGDRLARRNALILAFAQALAGANNIVIVGTVGILGGTFGDKAHATVPVSCFVVGMWAGTLPVGAIAKRYGRRAAFLTGATCGGIAGLVLAAAAYHASFLGLCIGAAFGGLYASAHQSYRFAAADTASEAFKPKAISWVLGGGVLAGVFGPQLTIATQSLLAPYLFAASYLAQTVVAMIAALVLWQVKIPKLAAGGPVGEARPLAEIFRQPRLIVAVFCGVVSYSMMNLIMTSAPVAMVDCDHSITDATLGLQWHVMAMFAPSFFTGSLVARFGAPRLIASGFLLMALSVAVALSGIAVWQFWVALALLGLGWNFAFIAATALVTQCHRPSERNKVQSVNDFLVFGSMAVGSFSSGQLLANYGWAAVNEVALPGIFAGLLLLALIGLAPKAKPAGAV